MKVYLSGPMTGYFDFNRPLFNKAAKWLRDHGHEVMNPAELPFKEDQRPPLDQELHWIVHQADAMAMLPDWEYSLGAFSEWTIARAVKLKFLYLRREEIENEEQGVDLIRRPVFV